MITADDLVVVLTWVAALAVIAFVFGGLLVLVLRQQKVHVQEDLVLDRSVAGVAADVEHRLQTPRLRGAVVRVRAPGQAQVVVREAPGWAIIPTIMFFPLGALALLVKQEVILDVYTFESGTTTTVRLSGITRQPVLAQVREALAGLQVIAASR